MTAWFFFVVAALFLAQALLGGAIEHLGIELRPGPALKVCRSVTATPTRPPADPQPSA